MKAIDAIVPPIRKLVNRHSLIRSLFMPVRYCFRLLFYTELHDSIERRSIWLERRLLNDAAKHFERYREQFKGKRCFVIGNGPSLNELDLTKLKDELTIGSNGLYLNFDRMGFYPTFYTVTNSLIAEQMGTHIANIEESIKVFPLFLMKYFQNINGEVNFLRTIAGYVFSQDVTNWISWQSTVTHFNLQIAFSLGCPEVYLIGVDNSYSGSEKSKEGKVIIQEEPDTNHFSSEYFHKGFKWHQADTDKMTRVYEIAFEAFKEHDRMIMNAGKGGMLEVFPRIPYEDLF